MMRYDVEGIFTSILINIAQVFGAFISSELVGRHGARFFGNGESFIFSLKPVNDCYRWSRETDLILRGTDHELAVGSGGG